MFNAKLQWLVLGLGSFKNGQLDELDEAPGLSAGDGRAGPMTIISAGESGGWDRVLRSGAARGKTCSQWFG